MYCKILFGCLTSTQTKQKQSNLLQLSNSFIRVLLMNFEIAKIDLSMTVCSYLMYLYINL